jgi:hypothetical protein
LTAMRAIFDTNAFSAPHFDALDGSPMVALCRSRRIVPVYGHVLLEETFGAYAVENKRPDLVNRWLPFIAKTVDRFCEDFVTIWHRELVQGHGTKTNMYMSRSDQEALIARFPRIPLDGSWRAWQASQEAREVEYSKREAQRETSKDIRKEVADWRKAVNYHPKRHGLAPTYAKAIARGLDEAGRGLLVALVPCWNPAAVAERWSRSKSFYPYFTTFVVNMLYMEHWAATRPNDKIDLNAQADLDLMTHLLHADVLVSNESGFLRRAFEDLWRPRGKVLFTSQEFGDYLKKLQAPRATLKDDRTISSGR